MMSGLLPALRCMRLLGDAHKQLFISTPSRHWPSPPPNIWAFAPSGILAATHRHSASPVHGCLALPPFASWLAPLLALPAVRSTAMMSRAAALVVHLAARRGGGESNGLRFKVDRNRPVIRLNRQLRSAVIT